MGGMSLETELNISLFAFQPIDGDRYETGDRLEFWTVSSFEDVNAYTELTLAGASSLLAAVSAASIISTLI